MTHTTTTTARRSATGTAAAVTTPRNDIVLCGVGGQGTVLASKLLSTAAMGLGLAVKAAETIGMAQRGGSVTSHVRIGEGAASLLIGQGAADLLVAFEPAEAARALGLLRPGGVAVVASRPVIPVSATTGGPAYDLEGIMGYLGRRMEATGGRLVVVDADAAARELGSAKCLNVVLLGAALRTGVLSLEAADIERAIRARVPEQFWDLNLRALAWAGSKGRLAGATNPGARAAQDSE